MIWQTYWEQQGIKSSDEPLVGILSKLQKVIPNPNRQ